MKFTIYTLSLILIITIGIFHFRSIESTFHKAAFERYYSDFKFRYVSAYGLGNIDDFQDGLKFAKDYNVCLESRMLMALSAIENEDFQKAVSILSEIDSYEARWIKALCYMRSGDDIKAKGSLRDIAKENNLFSPDAVEIIEKHY